MVTLGLSPNQQAQVVCTASAVLMDTRNGYVYGVAEATEKGDQLASAWTSSSAVDDTRRRTEAKAFEKLVGEMEKSWVGVVRTYAKATPVAMPGTVPGAAAARADLRPAGPRGPGCPRVARCPRGSRRERGGTAGGDAIPDAVSDSCVGKRGHSVRRVTGERGGDSGSQLRSVKSKSDRQDAEVAKECGRKKLFQNAEGVIPRGVLRPEGSRMRNVSPSRDPSGYLDMTAKRPQALLETATLGVSKLLLLFLASLASWRST